MQKKTSILGITLSKRTELIKLILAACILAMGTSLIANFLSDFYKDNMLFTLFFGSMLIILVILFFIYTIIVEAKSEIEINAIIAVGKNDNNVLSIFRYKFSETLADTMKAVFLENEALKQYWMENYKKNRENNERKPEDSIVSENDKKENKKTKYYSIARIIDENPKKEKTKSDKILEEMIEYLILEQLSTHLSNYFNNYSQHDKLIKEYTRTDFPEILLQNRIINLLLLLQRVWVKV